MPGLNTCVTPLLKQLFVVAGVSLNMANMGSVTGFPAILLPQLRAPDSDIHVDASFGSWIASIIGISLIVGNFAVPTLMGKFGRKTASLTSSGILLVCWVWIVLATDVTSLLIARCLQGVALGINLPLSPIMIGELTSPVNRGIFSSIMASSITATTLLVHVLGSYSTWRITALVCALTTATGLSILIFSPESPSWLADKERYEDSAKAFRWLRGEEDVDELEKMLNGRRTRDVKVNNRAKYDEKGFLNYISRTMRKKEFYKPVFIMIHLNTLTLWTGMAFLIVYTVDVLHIIVGNDIDVALHLTLLDVQRLISTIIALVVIKKVNRRTILFTTVGVNLAVLIVLAAYTFVREKLQFDHPAIGIILMHIHICSLSTGALPLPLILSGELFPLEFRSLAGGISSVAFSLNYFITSKTALSLLSAINVYGSYTLYSVVTVYCLVIAWFFLPETKDRTLQDIEDDFKGMPKGKSLEDLVISLPLRKEKNGIDEEVS